MPAITCPHCGHHGNVPDHLVGRKVRCKRCRGPILLQGAAPAFAPEPLAEPEPPPAPASPGLSAARVVFGFVRALFWGAAAAVTVGVALLLFDQIRATGTLSIPDRLDALLLVFMALVLARCVDGITRW